MKKIELNESEVALFVEAAKEYRSKLEQDLSSLEIINSQAQDSEVVPEISPVTISLVESKIEAIKALELLLLE